MLRVYTLDMRIDPALCKNILVAVEADPNAGSGQILNIAIEGYDSNVIAQHITYLWETKKIKGIDVTHHQSPCTPEIAVTDITAAGRQFLDQDELEPELPPKQFGF